ncbi:MAG: tetratricopeptide repeat protein, partial [Opitutaceae bacterium]
GLEASAATGDWEAAVAVIESELRRALTHGFTAVEIQEQASARRAHARAAVDILAGEAPDTLATAIATAVAAAQSWQHPATIAAETDTFAAALTPDEAAAALRTLFAEQRLHVFLLRNAPPAGGSAALATAWRDSAARPLDPAPPPAPLEFQYPGAPTAGTVASRRPEADLGLDLVTFGNGVRLNLRPSRTEPGRFRIAARLGRGLVDFPRERPGLGHIAAHLLKASDLRRHSRPEINRLVHLHALSFHATYDHRYLVEITGPVTELPFALRLLAAEFSDVRLDPARFSVALSDTSACRSAQLEDGGDHARQGILALMAGGDPRLREPPPTAIGDYTYAEVVTWLRAHWLDGPLELALTGDLDSAATVNAVAATLGALPRQRDLTSPDTERPQLRSQPVHETQRETLADATAAVRLAWPMDGTTDPTARYAMLLATDVLVDRLHRTLRQELGATYTPQGGLFAIPQHHAFEFASVALTFAPDRAPELARRAIELADELARDGVTAEEFTRLGAPLRVGAIENLRSNDWWLDHVLAHAQSDPAVLATARELTGAYDRLTRDTVNRVAAAHFKSDRASSLIVIPIAPAPSVEEQAPATAVDFIARGIARISRGELEAALADFDRALVLDPKNDEAYLSRGVAKMSQGDLDTASADFTQAIALNAKNAMAYVNRAVAKLQLGAIDAAIADCTKAIELDPALASAYSNRAAARFVRSDLDGCIADANKALELDPTNAIAYVNRSAARSNKGEIEGALADSTKAIENDPRNADGYNNRGYIRLLKGELDAALPDFDRAIELNPRSTNSYRNRGVIHQTKGRTDAALADYNKTIELSPDDVVARFNRGIILREKGDQDGAIADYDHSIRLDPKNADAFNNRGHAKQLKGDLDGAITDFTKAIELRPDYALAFVNRGAAKRAKGDRLGSLDDTDQGLRLQAPVAKTNPSPAPAPPPVVARPKPATTALIRSANTKRGRRDFTGARADLDKAIAADPDYPDTYVMRASLRASQNDLTGALTDTNMALILRPTFAGAFIERGIIRRTQRDYAAAISDLDRAIALDPKLAGAYFNRGLVHEARRDWRAAIADFERTIALSANHVAAFNSRGYARQQQGDNAKAIADFTEALNLSDTF